MKLRMVGPRSVDRFLDLDGDGAHHALAHVLGLVVLLEEILEGLGDGLAVGREMGAAVAGVLAVDERGDVLAVAAAVGKDDLDVRTFDVDERVERLFGHVLGDEVQEAVFALIGNPVQDEGETFLEVGIVLHHRFHDVHVEGIAFEHLVVGGEADEGAVLLGRVALAAVQQDAAAEVGEGGLAVAVGFHQEGLGADAVHTHGLLEGSRVELTAGVQLGNHIHHLSERDAASEVAHGHGPVLVDGDVDALAIAHRELVDGVVDDLFQEDVDTVTLPFAIAQAADVHTGTPPDVFVPLQGNDVFLTVVGSLLLQSLVSHFYLFSLSCKDTEFFPQSQSHPIG